MALQKAKLALAIATVSSSLAMTGCLVDGNKSNDTSTSTTVHEDASRISVTDQQTPTAEILGIVQDTNGNPVAGARVSIGSATTMTDENGAYSLADVAVVGFNDEYGEGYHSGHEAIQVSILPVNSEDGTNYLSATVSVTPKASTIIQTEAGDHTNAEDALIAIITTDGLAVSAGVTVIPALNATLTGVLRDETTGEVIPNTVIGLDMIGIATVNNNQEIVNLVDQQQTQNNGNGTSYGVGKFQAVTDGSGAFRFENLPEDTIFLSSVEDWTVESIDGGLDGSEWFDVLDADNGEPYINDDGFVGTLFETISQNVGTIYAAPIISHDNKDPFVISVTGVIANQAPGLLNDDLDGTQGLTINFSEPLQPLIDENSVFLYDTDAEATIAVEAVVLGNDGTSLTITTSDAIPAGHQFEIYLNKADFQDLADNTLIYRSGTPTFDGKLTPAYDSNAGLTSVGTVKLTLQTYKDPLTAAGAVVNLVQLTTDGGTSDHSTLQAFNATFSDVDTGSLNGADDEIEQLNATEAANRLETLADALYNEGGISGESAPDFVSTSVARVQFTLDGTTPSRRYLLTLKNEAGAEKNLNTSEVVEPASVVAKSNSGNSVLITIEDGFSGTVDLLLKGVDVNDQLIVSSITDYGIADGMASRVLTDQVGPTTIIQSNYGTNDDDTATVFATNYGNGGELTDEQATQLGAPLLNVTPRMLVPQVREDGIPLDVSTTWDALEDATTLEVSASNVYDNGAIVSWSVGSRQIGIAVSEDISMVTNATPAFSGTQALSGWAAQNNVLRNDANGAVMTDLVRVTVPDVVALANTDHNAVINLSNTIEDKTGNVANAANKASVVLQDKLPALLLNATYSGERIVLTFNEAISFEDGDRIYLTNATLTLNSDNTSLSSGNTVMTIERDAWGGEFNLATAFAAGSYDHDSDGDSDTPTPERGLTLVNIGEIADSRGNTWNADAAGVSMPRIIMPDAVGEIAVTVETENVSNLKAVAANTGQVVTYTFTHPIDVDAWLGSAQEDGVITLAEADVETHFSLTSSGGGQSINTSAADATPPGTTVTISEDRTRVTVNLVPVADINTNATHSLVFDAAVPSVWTTGSVVVDPVTLEEVVTP